MLCLAIFVKDFALERGYHPRRLVEFVQDNKKFAHVYEIAQAHQESRLLKGGLYNTFNAGFTKFVLINKHNTDYKSENADDSQPKFQGNIILGLNKERIPKDYNANE